MPFMLPSFFPYKAKAFVYALALCSWACGKVPNSDPNGTPLSFEQTDTVSFVDLGPNSSNGTPNDTTFHQGNPPGPGQTDASSDHGGNNTQPTPPSICGDSICNGDEDEVSCPNDCYSNATPPSDPAPSSVCGDGECSEAEDENNCPHDCVSDPDPPTVPSPPEIVADCSQITQASPAWEVCETSPTTCKGVFKDGAGCQAYCAAAGMECIARFGGEPGCQKEANNPLACEANNGHTSDWCECGNPGGTPIPPDQTQPVDNTPIAGPETAGDCSPSAGSLTPGATYTVNVDAFSGQEGETQPKTDSNNGQNGDNPQYRRHNIARGSSNYWYSSTHQHAGEPDPNSDQWVDYVPDFNALGRGCYQITAQYRGTNNRALYPAHYRLMNTANGDILYERVQQRLDGAYVDEDLGAHQMCANSFARIQDPGPNSICMNKMRFKYLGPTCP